MLIIPIYCNLFLTSGYMGWKRRNIFVLTSPSFPAVCIGLRTRSRYRHRRFCRSIDRIAQHQLIALAAFYLAAPGNENTAFSRIVPRIHISAVLVKRQCCRYFVLAVSSPAIYIANSRCPIKGQTRYNANCPQINCLSTYSKRHNEQSC